MWSYSNPVKIEFGAGCFDKLTSVIGKRRYALISYCDATFDALSKRLQGTAGKPVLTIDDIDPNPDYGLLGEQCERFIDENMPEVIVAVGGGSVIDSAKVFAAASGDFGKVQCFLETKTGANELTSIPIIAVPTTAGTGSEVTCWATVWDERNAKKYSLAHESLYPEIALIDPELMLSKPYQLTLATGLDALSHSLESIWNVNSNPVSARYAVAAARSILKHLPALLSDPGNLKLRRKISEASLNAGMAFSNTKTAIAHSLSYPITLEWGVQHGIACSFTLPIILQSIIGSGGFREKSLKKIFGKDLETGARSLIEFLQKLGVRNRFVDYGIPSQAIPDLIEEAFAGERGKNFIGTKKDFIASAAKQAAMSL